MGLILVLLLVLILAGGGLPQFGFHNLGYWPSGSLGLVLLIVIIVLLVGRR